MLGLDGDTWKSVYEHLRSSWNNYELMMEFLWKLEDIMQIFKVSVCYI